MTLHNLFSVTYVALSFKHFLTNSAEMLQHDSSQFPLPFCFGVSVAWWVTDRTNSCLYVFTLRGDGVLQMSVTLIKCLRRESWPRVCLCPRRCWDKLLLSSQPACENSLAFLRTSLPAHWIWTCPSSARKASWPEKHLPGSPSLAVAAGPASLVPGRAF